MTEAEREALSEDAEDTSALESRAGEPLISYDEMVKRLKEEGQLPVTCRYRKPAQ